MSKTTRTYCNDEIDFLYLLHPHGASDLVLYIMEEEISIRISHLFANPMEELIKLAMALLGGQNSYLMRLNDGTGSVQIKTERPPKTKDILKVSILECEDEFSDFPTCDHATEFLVHEGQFVTLIYYQMAKVRALCKNENYQKHRAKFPHQQFEELESRLMAQSA